MKEIQEQIMRLKKEKNAVIMAHYYVDDAVQEIADYVGDSYYLSDMATKVEAERSSSAACLLWVKVKILNPGKRVLLPDVTATVRWRIWLRWRKSAGSGRTMAMMWR